MSMRQGSSRRPSPLPAMLTALLGRDHESADLTTLLQQTPSRLITVTGPAGVGKTRLVIHVAENVLDAFEGDVAFVQLASIQDAEKIYPAIGQAFGLIADVAAGYDDQLFKLLQDRRALILLDNCEQIPGAAGPISRLLAECRQVVVLATSQAPIGLAGEQLYPLSPLKTPKKGQATLEAIEQSDAATLFLTRARAVNPNLVITDANASAIAEICRYLDGLPLAIELAAARTNVLSPVALLARLTNRLEVLGGERRDVPDRLRTMRQAISWSYELLGPEEQWLFRHLAIFKERFSLDAVEAIFASCGSDRAGIDVLGTLVDRSLVRRSNIIAGEDRYFMFQTLRDFGLEQLEALGEEQVARLAHARVMVRLAEEAEPHLVQPDQDVWLDRLDADRGNIRAAIEWALDNGHEEVVFRMTGAIWRFCAARGLITECRAWLDRAFAAQGNHLTPHRTRALIAAGYLAEDHRDLDAAERFFTQARHLAAAIGDSGHECRALIGLATVAHDRSKYETALQLHHEALNMARAIGDARSVAVSLGNLGAVSYFLSKPEDAIRYWEESRTYLVQIGDAIAEATTLMNLGALMFQMGQYAKAERYHTRALALQRQMSVMRDIPFTLINLSEVAVALGDLTLAHDTIAEAISLLQELGSPELLGIAYNGRARIAFVEGNDAEAAAFVIESMNLLDPEGNQLPLIENGELIAEISSRRGMHAVAVELLHAAHLARERIGAARYQMREEAVERLLHDAHESLDDASHARAIEAAEGMEPHAFARRVTMIARESLGRRRRVAGNGSADVAESAAVGNPGHNLTAREVEVLTLLAQGNSTAQIAEQLFVSPRTATTHINNILGKLGVKSRTAAVAYALRIGLV